MRTAAGRPAQPDRKASQRELLVMAVRDTLRQHGIPPSWIGAETLTASINGKERGMHLRLLLQHWEPRLLVHIMALEKSVRARVRLLDPRSSAWVAGISWKLDLPEDVPFAPLPDAGCWQRLISNPPPLVQVAQPKAKMAMPRAVLKRVFASGDGQARHARPDFSPTQPLK
jgi:hypothetical protein